MNLRRKLLAALALTAILSVAAVAWIISSLVRRSFEKTNGERTVALVEQFRRNFARQGEEVARRVGTIAAGDAATRMALALGHGSPDFGVYLNEAKAIAENQQLDFLEFVDAQGTILSSAQWPAKFGYKDRFWSADAIPKEAFLKREELPDGAALGVFAVREVSMSGTNRFLSSEDDGWTGSFWSASNLRRACGRCSIRTWKTDFRPHFSSTARVRCR